MHVLRCLSYINDNSSHNSKCDLRAHRCDFLGYSFGQKGYKVMDIVAHAIKVSRDVAFFKDKFSFALVSNYHAEPSVVMPHCPPFPVPNTCFDFASSTHLVDSTPDPSENSAESDDEHGEGVILRWSKRISKMVPNLHADLVTMSAIWQLHPP